MEEYFKTAASVVQFTFSFRIHNEVSEFWKCKDHSAIYL